MKSCIFVEGGGTATRAALMTSDEKPGIIHEQGPSNPAAYGIDRAAQRIVALTRSLLAGASPGKIKLYAALAGAAEKDVQIALAQKIGEQTGLEAVFICPDLHAMLHANAGEEEGILVIAGTGAAVLARDRSGKLLKIGGWGALLGDEGSAYGIAIAALRAAVRSEDGMAPPTQLRSALTHAAGLPDFVAFTSWVGKASKREIAALAPAVIKTAEEGDAQALQTVKEEACYLAKRIEAAHTQLALSPETTLFQYGGLVEGSSLFRDLFHEALATLPALNKIFCTRRGLDAVAALTSLKDCPPWAHCWQKEDDPGSVTSLPQTEEVDRGKALDELTPQGIVARMQQADEEAVAAVGDAAEIIAATIAHAGACIQSGGRLIYIGAGTSGRLGVLDASECPPTFGVSPDRVVGLIAGGDRALRDGVEGAEDDRDRGAEELAALMPCAHDFVIGIAASGTTPYVAGALEQAKKAGAQTALITSNLASPIPADFPILLNTGAEVLTGSTRLKAGTAAKLVLNRISTGAMAQAGLIYKGRMIGMAPVNVKLRHRAERIVSELCDLSLEESRRLLDLADHRITVAVVMALKGLSAPEAERLLEEHNHRLRDVLSQE